MRNRLKKLRMSPGRGLQDLCRKVPQPDFALSELLMLCERLHAQVKTDSSKLYSKGFIGDEINAVLAAARSPDFYRN